MLDRVSRTADLGPIVTLGLAGARGAAAGAAGLAALERAIADGASDLRARFGGATAGQIPHLAPARDLYRALGIDPTRHRPSPEALTRRLLKGDAFPRVHPFVDLGNLWALRHGLPVGLYDVAKIVGAAEARLGRPGESYEGIRKGDIHLEGRLCLADEAGAFGNPTSDSARTAIDATSRDLLFVLFAPAAFDPAAVTAWLDWLGTRLRDWFHAEVASRIL